MTDIDAARERARDLVETLLNDDALDDGDRLTNQAAMQGLERKMANNFRILREERGWSQQDLSERLAEFGFDLHQTTIAKMEAGKRPIRVTEMFALEHVFRMPSGAVFFMSNDALYPELRDLKAELARQEERIQREKKDLADVVAFMVEMTAESMSRRTELVRIMRNSPRDDG